MMDWCDRPTDQAVALVGDGFGQKALRDPLAGSAAESANRSRRVGESEIDRYPHRPCHSSMPNDPSFELALRRLSILEVDIGQWADDEETFRDADGKAVKCYDDVLMNWPSPVSGGVDWIGGDAKPDTRATVIMFSMGVRSLALLECYCEPPGLAFGWEETTNLRFY